jgi:hypothetical protein
MKTCFDGDPIGGWLVSDPVRSNDRLTATAAGRGRGRCIPNEA